MSEGWHCLHLFYRVDQKELNALTQADRSAGRDELVSLLDASREGAPERLQVSVVSGHKADLAVLAMDADPLKINDLQHSVRSSKLGTALVPAWSFVSITEVSEYVPTVEQYAERLRREGAEDNDPAFRAKIASYEKRLPMMNRQRLYPDLPPLPVCCFYPMNKIRHPLANWYQEPFSRRSDLMAEHATSGIQFAGRVTQVITASTGFDDWEWGVTLWSRTPEDIKNIVYTMRFDEASARYAEFGPFYLSYVMPPADALRHLKV
jgi:peroxiredoxin